MRIVYHGGIEQIARPLVHIGRANLDFGNGFYVTDIRNQAKTWAELKRAYFLADSAVINEYAFDFDRAVKEYRYKRFELYDSEWLHFIVASRSGKPVWRNFDIIEGGVANDRVIDTIEAYLSGMMDEERALGELSKHRPNNQICLLNQAVVDTFLRFVNSIKL